jgi:Helix-turn-helix domain
MTNYNPNLVKIHRSYTIEEAGEIFGIHKNTVSQWLKNGLPFMSHQKPYLILGVELKRFLQNRRKLKKHKCNVDEMYCLRCKKPSTPAENFVEYLPQTNKSGRLIGLCSCCECIIQKIVSLHKLEEYSKVFDISKP